MSGTTNNNPSLSKQVVNATKWSMITEFALKFVSPVSAMILARILTPEAFGIMATALMVNSFAELFADAGFSKYIIQHEFSSKKDLNKSANVAFWSNMTVSIVLWIGIIIFSGDIARIVGSPGYGEVIAVSSLCIPIAAFASLQMAIYKRGFDFKSLFWVRMIGVFIPFAVTIPIALLTHSYWALVAGNIALNLSNALILTIKSPWRPSKYFNKELLKEMFAFSMWTMIESISIWLTGWADFFIIGTMLTPYYLGLYRNSTSTVGQIMGIITAVTTPVLFPALSRLQSNPSEFKQMFFKFEKVVALLVFPLGMGIWIFRDFITYVLLGEQWMETADFIGMWGLSGAIITIFSAYCSEVYRAKGKPKLSVLVQITHLCFLVPVIYFTAGMGYDTLCESRCLVRLTLVVINAVALYSLVRISFFEIFKEVFIPIVASIAMLVITLWKGDGIMENIIYIIGCIILYFAIVLCFKNERSMLMNLKAQLKR